MILKSGYVKEMMYDKIESMWYQGPRASFEELELLSNNPQALKMADIANKEGIVQLYDPQTN